MYKFSVWSAFIALKYMLRSGLAGPYGNAVLINLRAVFQTGCIILHSHMQSEVLSFSTLFNQHLPSLLLILAILTHMNWYPVVLICTYLLPDAQQLQVLEPYAYLRRKS